MPNGRLRSQERDYHWGQGHAVPFPQPVTPSDRNDVRVCVICAFSVVPSPKMVPVGALTRNSPLPSLSISNTASLSGMAKTDVGRTGIGILVFVLLGPMSMRHMNVPSLVCIDILGDVYRLPVHDISYSPSPSRSPIQPNLTFLPGASLSGSQGSLWAEAWLCPSRFLDAPDTASGCSRRSAGGS